jgi:glucose/arabinose dehydrogenase
VQTTSVSDNIQNQPVSFQKIEVVKGLERPWAMAWLPDQTMLITERVGRVQMLQNGKLQQVPLSFPNLYVAGQAGLMDIALHPKFSENKFVYFTYAAGDSQANRTSILRAKFDGKAFSEPQVILEVKPDKSDSQHFGSRMTWLPDATMLIAIGDGGNPPLELNGELIRAQAQKLDSRLGKILRINDDGTIPKDNPFVNTANADPAVWSYGHRNIQGLFVDRQSGKIWATEHGARGGDELNLVEAGKNYGWPLVSYSQEYFGGDVSNLKTRRDIPEPKVIWTPSIAPSGLMVYQGDRFPSWQGSVFAGGLVSRDVVRISVKNNQAKIQESIPIGQRVRDVREGKDGLIYILTDEQNGQLIRIQPQK